MFISVIQSKVDVQMQTIDIIDLDHLASRTEGFVARDIVTIVERAIHAGCSREIALGKRPSPMPPSQKGKTVTVLLSQTCKRWGDARGRREGREKGRVCGQGHIVTIMERAIHAGYSTIDCPRQETVTSDTITERYHSHLFSQTCYRFGGGREGDFLVRGIKWPL